MLEKRTLTVLAAIRPGEEDRLRDVLRPIGDDIAGKRRDETAGPRIDFLRSRRIHFARFAILGDPDRGPDRKRLLYAASYDGELDGHLAELTAITSDMAAIWGRCEGYTGAGDFGRFIREHAHQPDAWYIAFRDQTADSIRDAIALRQQAQTLVDAAAAGSLAALVSRVPSPLPAWAVLIGDGFASAGRSIAAGSVQLIRALPIVADLVRAIARCGIGNVFFGAQRITASLNRYPLLRLLNRVTGNRLPPRQSAYSSVWRDNCSVRAPLVPGDEAPSGTDTLAIPTLREDVVSQNQLTLVTVVKPGEERRVRAVMSAIDAYAKRLAPAGSLIGVSTIHFVRWLILDGGTRLMMVSDYDGSWESYIDEFAEMILSGLDAIWETSYGYPPDGARDLPAFKRFLRSHQVPSEVFFSAYPEATVLNIANDRALARACADAAVVPLGSLLQRF